VHPVTDLNEKENMTESEIIDEILSFKSEGYKAAPHGVSSEDYNQAFESAIEHGLINHFTRAHYELTSEGKQAVRLGGVDKWLEFKERHNAGNPNNSNTINFHAPVTGSVVNQDSPLRDLKYQSPIVPISQPVNATPNEKPIKKSDHTIWDKIKYVSGVIVGVGSIAALAIALGKWRGLW
jgi:hypothetical protein